jgi:uncharacterized protein (TIGR02596 family)
MNKSLVTLSRRAFSLMELIVVIAIIGVIATFAVPQAGQILKGSTLTQGSSMLEDQIRLAREYAVTKNCKVEVRFYQYADPEMPEESVSIPRSWNYRAVQTFQVITLPSSASGAEATLPLDKVQMLPQGVIMNPTQVYSTLLWNPNSPVVNVSSSAAAQNPSLVELPRGVGFNYNYVSFRFMPDGSTNLAQVPGAAAPPPWFITLHNATDRAYVKDQTQTPYNYFCLQIDPVTGSMKFYRPQAG